MSPMDYSVVLSVCGFAVVALWLLFSCSNDARDELIEDLMQERKELEKECAGLRKALTDIFILAEPNIDHAYRARKQAQRGSQSQGPQGTQIRQEIGVQAPIASNSSKKDPLS